MTKQQENRAFVKMLKEFPKAFGRVSFRERLMLKTAFTYVLEARYEDRNSIIRQLGERCNQLLKDKGDLTDKIADIKANCDLAIEGRDIKVQELEEENAELREKVNILDNCDRLGDVITEAYKDQLTKAIGIIKRWYETNRSACIEPSQELIEVTEQFLKEIEK